VGRSRRLQVRLTDYRPVHYLHVSRLAVAATSPRYAAAYTYPTSYAVESPPAQPTSCATATAATSKAEADSATSATATTAASAASATTTTTTVATAAAATSGELHTGLG
jgi:hypothetical protein